MTSTPRDRGQAAVEFAIVSPAVVVLVLGILQVTSLAVRQAALEQLARSGARAASVAASPGAAASAEIGRSTSLAPLTVETVASDDEVEVSVTFVDPTSVPIIGIVIGDVELSASATMQREPP